MTFNVKTDALAASLRNHQLGHASYVQLIAPPADMHTAGYSYEGALTPNSDPVWEFSDFRISG